MPLDDIKDLIARKEYEISSKVRGLIEEGFYDERDLENCILAARRIHRRERDELRQAVDGMKYVIIGLDTQGQRFYTAGKIMKDYTGRFFFFITAHQAV